MTVGHEDIQEQLEAHLKALDPAFPTAWQNVTFKPTAGVAHQRVFYLPATDQAAGIGAQAGTKFQGVFQVSLYFPAGNGRGDAGARAKLIEGQFKRGTRLVSADGNTRVVVLQPYRGPALSQPDWYVLPVSIPWLCYGF